MKFEKRSLVSASARELYDWHGRPGALARLTPPWLSVEVSREDPGLHVGKRVDLKLSTPVGKRRWLAKHVDCKRGHGFTDTQERGPFKSWTHRHAFIPKGDLESELLDSIEYELPLGKLGQAYVLGQLEKSFDYRHWVTKRDLALRASLPGFRPLKVAITGGSGFLGAQLSALLSSQGHSVFVVTRNRGGKTDIRWNPAKGEIELSRLEGMDAVVHLAGENLSSGRWSAERKKLLWASRVDATNFLVDAFLRLERPPGIFLSGSGIGFLGSGSDSIFTEKSKRGDGFLAELCEGWERAALRAEFLGARVCLLRSGVVLDPRGGALRKLLPAYRFGLGGPLGDGEQWFPWIALEDWLGAVNRLLFVKRASGPFNLVAPQALRQKEFARILGKAVGRPAVLPAPKFILRALLGEMADEALLSSIRAEPAALEALGYEFVLPELGAALARVLR